MKTPRLGTQGDITWPKPTVDVRPGHREWQVERSWYPGIDFLCSNQLYNMNCKIWPTWFVCLSKGVVSHL
jgi:hypothetical protein